MIRHWAAEQLTWDGGGARLDAPHRSTMPSVPKQSRQLDYDPIAGMAKFALGEAVDQ
jgi:hypothetical protein